MRRAKCDEAWCPNGMFGSAWIEVPVPDARDLRLRVTLCRSHLDLVRQHADKGLSETLHAPVLRVRQIAWPIDAEEGG